MPPLVQRLLMACALTLPTANGFVSPSMLPALSGKTDTVETPPSQLYGESFWASTNLPIGEASRPYRRTVYTHNDWVKHRSPNRFAYYLSTILKSGIYKNMSREVFVAVSMALFCFFYNVAVGGYTDLLGDLHRPMVTGTFFSKLTLPLTPFTLASPSLGLFLVFRTNTAYKRWDEARKNWGMNINHTRDLVRMANAFYDDHNVSPERREDDLKHVALCTWAFVRSMKRHLSPELEDEDDFRQELYEKLPQVQAEKIIAAAHRPNRALQDLSFAVDNLPMHFMRKNEIHQAITIFEDNLGSSERLLTSPVPVAYTREAARFLSTWILFLPFALYDSFGNTWNHIGMVFAVSLLSVFLFGIDELATQLEEPFTILPMQGFCDKIYNWCMEIISWKPGDYGRARKPKRPEHKYFPNMDLPTTSVRMRKPVPQSVSGPAEAEGSRPPPQTVSQPPPLQTTYSQQTGPPQTFQEQPNPDELPFQPPGVSPGPPASADVSDKFFFSG